MGHAAVVSLPEILLFEKKRAANTKFLQKNPDIVQIWNQFMVLGSRYKPQRRWVLDLARTINDVW